MLEQPKLPASARALQSERLARTEKFQGHHGPHWPEAEAYVTLFRIRLDQAVGQNAACRFRIITTNPGALFCLTHGTFIGLYPISTVISRAKSFFSVSSISGCARHH